MPADFVTRRSPGQALRVAAYRVFYRMPGRWRRRLVRLFKPRYTVGTVVLVRLADAEPPGRLLLLRQPGGRGWSLPGGLINRNERPIECAARELAEETGIEVAAGHLRAAVPNAVVHVDGVWIDLVFEADAAADTPLSVDGAEVYEAAFHPIDALPPVTVPTARLLAHFGMGPYADYPEVRLTDEPGPRATQCGPDPSP